MKTSTISLHDSQDETVEAEYYIIEDGWVTFKTNDHKAVCAYPEARVARIKSAANASPGVSISMGDKPLSAAEIAERVRSRIAFGV